MDIYTAICRRAYMPAVDAIRRIPFRRTLREAIRNQSLDAERMRTQQAIKLRTILDHARRNTRLYAERLERAGFDPMRLQTIDDIRTIPILEKDDVRLYGDQMRSSEFPGRCYSAATSGSTGISLRFQYDSVHAAWSQACVTRGRTWWGLFRGERQLLLMGHPVGARPSTELRIRLKHRMRNCIEFDTFEDLNQARALEILAALRRFRPRVIYGYGSGIGRLAAQLRADGIRLAPAERPVLVEYTADHMFEHEREAAKEVFGAPVVSFYGARECGGMAPSCPEGRLHWSSDHALCEIVREDGSPAEPGETGDLIVTPFDNFAMPFIRYRIGDRLAFDPEPCPCGVRLPVVRLAAGRTSETIATSERKAVSSVVFDFINRVDLVWRGIRGIRQFLVEQVALDRFKLFVIRDDPFDPQSVEIFVDKMKQSLGASIIVDVEFVEDIPLAPTGKRRWYKRSFEQQPVAIAESA